MKLSLSRFSFGEDVISLFDRRLLPNLLLKYWDCRLSRVVLLRKRVIAFIRIDEKFSPKAARSVYKTVGVMGQNFRFL